MGNELPEVRHCRFCGEGFAPKSHQHVTCHSVLCRRAAERRKKTEKTKSEERHALAAAKKRDNAPFGPCVSCVHWKKEPPGVTDMGGQCIAGLYRVCKPWDGAFHHKEARQ